MKFFLPDWDDRVDPGYDFRTDRFSLVRDPYADDLYAHELMGEEVYDGLLVSRMALLKSGDKRAMVERVGMRAYLRLPRSLELLGDCGAFGYLRDKEPRFETAEVIDYYERLGFDYGVSVDHAIVPEFEREREYRFELTLRNAEEFLCLYRRRGHAFTPIGACQGWDVHSYVESARALVAMGYRYIALGGLARSNTQTVASVVAAVRAVIPADMRVHVFGVARLSLLALFADLDIASVDSAAPLRQAWLSANDNYYALDRTYAAIRIPVAQEERPKAQTLVGRSSVALSKLRRAERDALAAVRAYANRELRLDPTLEAVLAYDRLLADRRDGQSSDRRARLYRETLRDRPWKRCLCSVCRALDVEVMIFRGNNRNRRRGFHNLWVLRQRIQREGGLGRPGHEGRLRRGKTVAATYPLELSV